MNKKTLTMLILFLGFLSACNDKHQIKKEVGDNQLKGEISSLQKEIEEVLLKTREEKELLDVDTSNWKEFHSDNVPYTFKYPEGWNIFEDDLNPGTVRLKRDIEGIDKVGLEKFDRIEIGETRNKDTAYVYMDKIRTFDSSKADYKYYNIDGRIVSSLHIMEGMVL